MEIVDGNGAPKKDPDQEGWVKSMLIEPEPGTEPPGEVWAKDVDGGTLRVRIWGDGSQAAPYALQIQHRTLLPPNRFPTWEEIQDAIHLFIEEGVIFALPPFEVQRARWETILEALDVGGWSAIPFNQAGALRGSEVAKKSPIILSGGPHGPARA